MRAWTRWGSWIVRQWPYWIYAGVLIFTASRHEVWRDEVGRFFLVTRGGTLAERFSELRSYGHPIVWDLVLYGFNFILRSTLAIKVAQLASALLMSWLVWAHSPFKRHEKILFLMGLFPVFEYGVISRNYAVSMVCLFLVAACYQDRFRHWLRYCLILFVFAQTHSLSLVCSAVLLTAALGELVTSQRALWRQRSVYFMAGAAIALAGMALCVIEARPSPGSREALLLKRSISYKLDRAIKIPIKAQIADERLTRALGMPHPAVATALLLSITLLLWRRWPLLWIWMGSLVGIRFFFEVARHGTLRHYGFIVFMAITVLWLLRREKGPKAGVSGLVLAVLLIAQIPPAWAALREDWQKPFSGSLYASKLILADASLKDAILIAEPDAFAEPLLYYVPNRIYFPREERFGFVARFDDRVKVYDYSLGRLIRDAKRIQRVEKRPVVLLVGYMDLSRRTHTHATYHGKTLSVTEHSYDLLMKHARPIGSIDGTVKRENYVIYRMN